MTTSTASRSLLRAPLALILLSAFLLGFVFVGNAPAALAETPALSAADLYEQNVESTVGISTSGTTVGRFGYGYTFYGAGSGFFISEDGYVLTNYHVVERSDVIRVATYNGDVYDAAYIGGDREHDIAVLKIEASGCKPVTLGDSDKLRVGEEVFAIGNPLGELSFSLTHGIVSALSREITTSAGVSMKLIQTDCAINSGNSGGPLFNSRGEVIGITNAKFSASSYTSESEIDNVCFAIPISSVKGLADEIVTDGSVSKPYLGIGISPLSEETAAVTGIASGVMVQSVSEGSPAEQAGIQVHDIIVKAGKTEIADTSDLTELVAAANIGDTLRLTVYRQGQEIELEVVVGSRSESAAVEPAPAQETLPAPEEPQSEQKQRRSGNPLEDFFNFYYGG